MTLYSVFDLDGTICDDRRRRKYLPHKADDPNWDYERYHEGLYEDPALPQVALVREEASKGNGIIFLTARPERYFESTWAWLTREFPQTSFVLLMRPEGNNDKSPEQKLESLTRYLVQADGDLNCVDLLMDDRCDVITNIQRVYDIRQCFLVGDNGQNINNVTPPMGTHKRTADARLYWYAVKAKLKKESIAQTVHQAVDSLPAHRTSDELEAMLSICRHREQRYTSDYSTMTKVIAALFPEGITKEQLQSDAVQLTFMAAMKLSRFAATGLNHKDSIRDCGVYCAMIASTLDDKDQEVDND